MNWQSVIESLLGSGPFGMMLAIMMWQQVQRDKRDEEREKRREAIEEKRIECDKTLAVAMAMLTKTIEERK